MGCVRISPDATICNHNRSEKKSSNETKIRGLAYLISQRSAFKMTVVSGVLETVVPLESCIYLHTNRFSKNLHHKTSEHAQA